MEEINSNDLQKIIGTITANGGFVSAYIENMSSISISMVATSLVGHNISFEVSNDAKLNTDTRQWDGTSGNWFGIYATKTNASGIETTSGVLAATPAYGWNIQIAGWKFIRVRATAHTSGTATYVIQPSFGATLLATSAVPVVQGTNAAGAAAAGSPVRVAMIGRTANNSVTNGQTTEMTATLTGAQIVKPFSIPELDWSYAAAAGGITNTTDVAAKTAAGAGLKNYVTSMSVQNASATTATEVVVKDGATIIWRGYLGTSSATNSKLSCIFSDPLRSSNNAAINVACVTTGAQVYVNMQGYVAP